MKIVKWFHLTCECHHGTTQFIKLGRLHVTYTNQRVLLSVMHTWELWSLSCVSGVKIPQCLYWLAAVWTIRDQLSAVQDVLPSPRHPDWFWGPPHGGAVSPCKDTGVYNWPLTSIYCWGQKWWNYRALPWYAFKHRDNLTFIFLRLFSWGMLPEVGKGEDD